MRAAIYKDENCSNPIEGFSVDTVEQAEIARVIGAPVETGTIAFDNKVIDPFVLIVRGSISNSVSNSSAVANEISKMLLMRDFRFYSVSDTSEQYTGLILKRAKKVRDRQHPDILEYELEYVHRLLVQKAYTRADATPRNAENTSTRNTGASTIKTGR